MANGLFTSIKKVLNIEFSLIDRSPDKRSYVAPVRVKGGMSLRNGMWNDVRNGIIMQNTSCGMT